MEENEKKRNVGCQYWIELSQNKYAQIEITEKPIFQPSLPWFLDNWNATHIFIIYSRLLDYNTLETSVGWRHCRSSWDETDYAFLSPFSFQYKGLSW